MSQTDEVELTESQLATIPSLMEDFARLGVKSGITILLHSSLKALGPVCGGPVAVILALENLLGPTGTLVMPTHTGGLSEPSHWTSPPVPESWWQVNREQIPAFDPDLTPTRQMGAIAECFRKQRGVVRSNHPHVSFAAWGQHAQTITARHELTDGLGESSPLARIYDLDGWVLLLGVGHGNNTSLHLSEYRANFAGKHEVENGAPVTVDGERRWVTFQALHWDDSDFEQIGAAFSQATGLEQSGKIAQATALLMPQPALVDYGVKWMEQYRQAVTPSREK